MTNIDYAVLVMFIFGAGWYMNLFFSLRSLHKKADDLKSKLDTIEREIVAGKMREKLSFVGQFEEAYTADNRLRERRERLKKVREI